MNTGLKPPLDFFIVATIASANNFDRERNCRFNANLVKWALRADAAALTKSGGGVPHTDLSETAREIPSVRRLERGISQSFSGSVGRNKVLEH